MALYYTHAGHVSVGECTLKSKLTPFLCAIKNRFWEHLLSIPSQGSPCSPPERFLKTSLLGVHYIVSIVILSTFHLSSIRFWFFFIILVHFGWKHCTIKYYHFTLCTALISTFFVIYCLYCEHFENWDTILWTPRTLWPGLDISSSYFYGRHLKNLSEWVL